MDDDTNSIASDRKIPYPTFSFKKTRMLHKTEAV